MTTRLAHLLLALAATTAGATAQTILVTTSDDAFDIPYWTPATLADLPGPDGLVSFGEALKVSDDTPGQQTIGFNIPQSEWWLPSIYPGQVLLYSMLGWSCSDSVIIDGTTQTAFTGDTFPGGNEIILDGLTLVMGGDSSILTGFHGSNVIVTGSGCEIHGNTGNLYLTLSGGSGSLVHDNEAGTIKIDSSNDNVVVRNTTDRVRVSGWFWGGHPALNNRIGGPTIADRNFITGWGNYGEHGVPGGTTVELFDTMGTLVQNNYIGTTPDGMSIGNDASTVGVSIQGINKDLQIRDNLIATRSLGIGVSAGVLYGTPIYVEAYGDIFGFTDGVEIFGNTLGLNAAGEPVLGGVEGVWVSTYAQEYAHDVRIGGPGPGQGNTIAGHSKNGVFMPISPGVAPAPGVGIRVSGNSIYGNGNLGIDLTPNTWTFGPTPNDPLDVDVGANGLQNYPDVASATQQGASLHVVGTLESSPLSDFTVELFASPACHPAGFGEGELFLGATAVSTDAAGDASFDVMLGATAPAGWFLTATATLEPTGRTSEFSACTPITGDVCQVDLGFGGPGDAVLSMCGKALASGASADITLSGAPAFTPAWLVVGPTLNPTPLLGGILVPVLPTLVVAATTDASGQLLVPGVAGGMGPLTLFLQAVVLDGAQPLGFGISNALQVDFLP